MSNIELTLTAAKKHAVRLQKLFAQKQIHLTHSESLEALANVFGKQNWHEFEQLFKTNTESSPNKSSNLNIVLSEPIEFKYNNKVLGLNVIINKFINSKEQKTLRIEQRPSGTDLLIVSNLGHQDIPGTWSDLIELMGSFEIYPLSFNPLPVCKQISMKSDSGNVDLTIQVTSDYKILIYKSDLHILDMCDVHGLSSNLSIYFNSMNHANLFIISNPNKHSDRIAAQIPGLILKHSPDLCNEPKWIEDHDSDLLMHVQNYLENVITNHSRFALPVHTFLHTHMNLTELVQYLYKKLSVDMFLLFVEHINRRTFIVETCILSFNGGILPVVNIPDILRGFKSEAVNIKPERIPQLIYYSLERNRQYTMSGLVDIIDKEYNKT